VYGPLTGSPSFIVSVQKVPSACTILDAPVVFWWDGVAEEWAAMLDVCPHRLVPLSEGRVCESGAIECPYHGWTFNGRDGTCTRIPQLEPGRPINQKRARGTSLPVVVRGGIIWCWAARLVGSAALPNASKLEALQVARKRS
jgi:phenylpropionate dioxygenase-like ring-hydroxylating dioxygenase large terminal subunit